MPTIEPTWTRLSNINVGLLIRDGFEIQKAPLTYKVKVTYLYHKKLLNLINFTFLKYARVFFFFFFFFFFTVRLSDRFKLLKTCMLGVFAQYSIGNRSG